MTRKQSIEKSETPSPPVLTITPLMAQIVFFLDVVKDGKAGNMQVQATLGQSQMNGISLGELAKNIVEQEMRKASEGK